MMMENKNMNIPNMTVNMVVEMLEKFYLGAINNGLPTKEITTVFLWGAAGIGKSEAVYQLAERLGASAQKTVTVTEVRLLLFTPPDLRGIPVADVNKEFCNWLMPGIFKMEKGEDHLNLLFLDELSAAHPQVQAAAYQICQNHRIGEHVLPDNCIVIAAGNRTTDQSVSYKMPKALCNRMMHINVQPTLKSWLKWAEENGVDERIIGYLSFDSAKLFREPESSDMAYPTPRSWEHVDFLLKSMGEDFSAAIPLIGANVGMDTALEFETWVKTRAKLPKAEEVLQGICTTFPRSTDVMLAFSAGLLAIVESNKESITARELENVCAYVSRFPTDFAMTFFSDLKKIAEVQATLMKCPSFHRWLNTHKACF